MNFFFYAYIAYAAAMGSPMQEIAFWIGGVTVLNMMMAAICILTHEDDITLLPLVLVQDLYQCLLINTAWVIAIFDEYRGARMRWHAG
ncbi:hypothetical protein ACRAWG_27720 [Methylobacterium sp. P31]